MSCRKRSCASGGISTSFEGRSSLRAWLYKIATNACLDALDARKSRGLPAELYPAVIRLGPCPRRLRRSYGWKAFPDTLHRPAARCVSRGPLCRARERHTRFCRRAAETARAAACRPAPARRDGLERRRDRRHPGYEPRGRNQRLAARPCHHEAIRCRSEAATRCRIGRAAIVSSGPLRRRLGGRRLRGPCGNPARRCEAHHAADPGLV